eukprot:13677630-Heterocapsa_arctica.AAC.1
MENPPSLDFKLALFIKQIKESAKLKTEWDNYYKAKPGSEIKRFEYLYNSALFSLWSARGLKPHALRERGAKTS